MTQCDLQQLLCPGAEGIPPDDPYRTPAEGESPPRKPLTPPDRGPPYLMMDLYPWDLDLPNTPQIDDPPWERILTNPELVAFVLKVSDGLDYNGHPRAKEFTDWFRRNFKKLIELFGPDRGVNRFAGGYHFMQAQVDGDAQGVGYVSTLWSAGWGADDIVPILDAEAGGPRTSNGQASRQQWIDNCSKFVARVKQETGRLPMFYGRNILWDHNISTIFGCRGVWNPSYTRYMVTDGLLGKLPNGQAAACSLDDIGWWQCIGDGVGDSYAHHIPLVLEQVRKGVDVSVCIDGARKPTMRRVRQTLL